MLSDIENLDIMLGENHFDTREREGSLSSNLPRRSRSFASNEPENEDGNMSRKQRIPNSRINAEFDRNSAMGNSSVEINRLSSELNPRISREMDEMVNSVNDQIQRAISDAISTQVLPQIQNVIMAGSENGTRKGWDVPSERPEPISEVQRTSNAKNTLKNGQDEDHMNNDFPNQNVHDMVTGENESPNQVPEFLTGRKPSRNHLNQSYEDINLDTTIPAQERIATAVEHDPISRLVDVLTNMQSRPTAQQLTIRPVNSNTMTFDGISEKFELFEDLFHTMIKMQPEMTEQMKINHFHSLPRKNALQTFRNISSAKRQTLEDVLVIFQRKYVKPESQATAKHEWHRLVFDPNTMKSDVNNTNDATEVTRNKNSDWPDSAVFHKKQEKSLPDLSDRQENDANFSERNSINENDAQNSPNRGDDIIVPELSENDARNEGLSPRGGKYNLRPNPNPDYSEVFRY